MEQVREGEATSTEPDPLNVGALIVRMGFGGSLLYLWYNKPQTLF